MIDTLRRLEKEKVITPPDWLLANTMYLTVMGSQAYGVSDDNSDLDIYGFTIPPITDVFPHTAGLIYGFDKPTSFEQYQQHHIHDRDALAGKGRVLDISVYGIVNYFRLCLEGNPNMIDSIFTPVSAVLHSTQVAGLVRENRRLFLHKGLYQKFKGYAYSQLHKMESQNRTGKRKEVVEEYGYDLKFASHVVRLIEEAEQLLLYGDMDIQLHREMIKSIRRGEKTADQVREYFSRKEKLLDELYLKSPLPDKPKRNEVRKLLYDCLEHHYGSLSNIMTPAGSERDALREIRLVLDRIGV